MEGRVLVISKDTKLMDFLQCNFSSSGYQVLHDQAEEELKSILDRVMPDLIILDIMMPRLDGIELCLSIRQRSRVPIIMLSTWGTGIAEVRGLDLSSESYLTEPFGCNEFKELFQEAIRRNSLCMNNNDYHITALLDATQPIGLIVQTLLHDPTRMN